MSVLNILMPIFMIILLNIFNVINRQDFLTFYLKETLIAVKYHEYSFD